MPDAEQVRRFVGATRGLLPDAGSTQARLALAVSGGPDSLALLVLAQAAFPGCVEAATVDHGLRPESAAEAAAVAEICSVLEVPHETLTVAVASGNLQAEARLARYGALAGWIERRGLAALLTGHHADDQAETLLMRLNRASGVAGLAGARARSNVPGTRLALVRPLLGWRRAELAAIVSDAGMTAAQDPSNADDRFDRARLRRALADADWLDVQAVAASAAHLADADAALDWAAAREWQECVRKDGPGVIYRPSAPRAVVLRVMARVIAEMEGSDPRGSAVARLFDQMIARQPGSIGNLVVRPLAGGWAFSPAPRRRPAD